MTETVIENEVETGGNDSTHHWTEEHVTPAEMYHDVLVNPRHPNDTWARRQLAEYDRGLLGMFVLSERLEADVTADGGQSRVLAVLDGSNRKNLMEMAGDDKHPVLCQVYHGLSRQQEARIAREYNDRQGWTAFRIFLAECAAGNELAVAIRQAVESHGWRVTTDTGTGTIRGVQSFWKLLQTAGLMAAAESGAHKGTERWNAAMVSGRQDGLRVLDAAAAVYTAAFPSRPSSFAPAIMYGIALLLLRDGQEVSMDRLAAQLRDHNGGHRQLIADARVLAGPMKMKFPDAIALLAIRDYNKGLAGNSRTRLDDQWKAVAR